MRTPSPQDILSVAPEGIADFLQSHASAKTMSDMVKRLNDDLIQGDQNASEIAARALHHLGFVENA